MVSSRCQMMLLPKEEVCDDYILLKKRLHKFVGRIVPYVIRRTELHNASVFHHTNPVAELKRLLHIMRNKHNSHPQRGVYPLD